MSDDINTVQGTTETTAASDVQKTGSSLLTTPTAEPASTNESANPDAVTPDVNAATTDAENKPEGDKAAETKPQGAPEKYEFTAPEGVTLDPEAVAAFEPVAKELNLTNEQAQKLVGLQAQLVQKQHEQWDAMVETWVKEIKGDKEIGGQVLNDSIKHAQRAISQFGTPELKTALDTTRMGNHPELVRVFARIGKAMAEDTFVSAGAPSGQKRDAAEVLFGDSMKNK
jgi:hypothetical protein